MNYIGHRILERIEALQNCDNRNLSKLVDIEDGVAKVTISHNAWVDNHALDIMDAQVNLIDSLTQEMPMGTYRELITQLNYSNENDRLRSPRFVNNFEMCWRDYETTYTVRRSRSNRLLFNYTIRHHIGRMTLSSSKPVPPHLSKVVDHVAGVLAYCALSSRYCEDMRASDIRGCLSQLVGPEIVEAAVKKVTSL